VNLKNTHARRISKFNANIAELKTPRRCSVCAEEAGVIASVRWPSVAIFPAATGHGVARAFAD